MISCRRTQCQSFYGHSTFEARWKGEEAPQVGAPYLWRIHVDICQNQYNIVKLKNKKIKRNHCFEVSSSLILSSSKPFLIQVLMCEGKSILYDNERWPAQWLDQEEALKHFPKPELHQRKSRSLFGGLPVWSTIVFWTPVKPLHLRSMLSKSVRCSENCSTCSQHFWSSGWAQFLPWRHLTSHCTTNASKVEQVGYEILSHPRYSPDLLPTYCHFFKYLDNFLQAKCLHNQEEVENAFQEFIESWSTDFYITGINKLISCW